MATTLTIKLTDGETETWHAGGEQGDVKRRRLFASARARGRAEGVEEIVLDVVDAEGVQLIHERVEV